MMRHLWIGWIVLALVAAVGPPTDEIAAIDSVLEDFHAAAARGDAEGYFVHFTPDAVFFGTDAAERWTVEEFRAYAVGRFGDDGGWIYWKNERNITVHPDGRTAWFDEEVESAHLGKCRGTGVLIKLEAGWKIAQYNLSIPVPNEFSSHVVDVGRHGLRRRTTKPSVSSGQRSRQRLPTSCSWSLWTNSVAYRWLFSITAAEHRELLMYYTVRVRFKPAAATDFQRKLRDGSIERQKPDGAEIVASMDRARVDDRGWIRWSEVCYCRTPLQHERATVYDRYFDDLSTEEAASYVDFDGRPFMEHLDQLAESPALRPASESEPG